MLTKLLKAARPPRAQVEPVAIDLIRRHGAEIMATARRYSTTREDAEDAYQQGLEILLTKAPSTRADDLVPWLKTVVKHEAYALHRARERAGQPTAPERIAGPVASPPEDQAERLEKLRIGAEALGRLKPQEIRCMLLLAEGHTYKQIQQLTGFSYTKVNRCLTEGRRSFLRRVERIESGSECERLAPLVSALADGEASAQDMAVLRPHMRSCLSCRAALRDAREVPARVAALTPIGFLAGGHSPSSGLLGAIRSAGDWVSDRLTYCAMRGQELIETASSHKLAAAAASAAALGGGGIATVEVGAPDARDRHGEPRAALAAKAPAAPARAWRRATAVVSRPAVAVADGRPRTPHGPRRLAVKQPAAAPLAPPEPARPLPAPEPHQALSHSEPATGEFGP